MPAISRLALEPNLVPWLSKHFFNRLLNPWSNSVIDIQEIEPRLDVAREAARGAGEIAMHYFCRRDLEVEVKQDGSPVTVADREAEAFLRGRIEAAFPDDAIVGEELVDRPGTSEYRWIIDPIDGTKSFIHGVPFFGTLVGVLRGDEPQVGVVYLGALDETVYARRGGGAWYQRKQEPPAAACVSTVARLDEALFCTTDAAAFASRRPVDAYRRIEEACGLTRTWGDCYGYVLVATGRAELMIDPVMNVWDAAPLLPILDEAGGTFTDWNGKPTIEGGEGIATNGRLLGKILPMLSS